MKKIFFLFSFLAFISIAQATHLMGGDLVLRHDSNGYYLHHTNYRDMVGIPALQTAKVSVYKYDQTNAVWVAVSIDVLPMDVPNSYNQLLGIPYGVQIYNYKSSIGYIDTILLNNGSGKYRCIVSDCCRNQIIGNMAAPNTENLTLTCDFEYDSSGLVTDVTPEFLALPVIFGPVNLQWNYNPLPYDADGDSLSWEIVTPIGGTYNSPNPSVCNGYTAPPANIGGDIAINPVTGEFAWTPNMLGNFVASFKIHEYRNGVEIGTVLRDMQYVVVTGLVNNQLKPMPSFTQSTPYLFNTAQQYNYIYYHQNQPFTFELLAEDTDMTNVMTMSANSELLKAGASNASFTYATTGIGNQVKGTFAWTPTLDDSRDKILSIRAQNGYFIKDFSIMLRKAEIPQGFPTIDKAIFNMNAFPNPNETNQLNLSMTSAKQIDNALLVIFDLMGRQVFVHKNLTVHQGNSLIQMPCNLAKGNYIIQLKNASEILANSKYSKL